MGRLSVLPASFEAIETWVARAFLLFAILTLGPWLLVFAYDFLLYFIRYALWELPVIGGKARGHRKPEPAKLVEHATGHKKVPSFARSAGDDASATKTGAQVGAAQDSRARNSTTTT